MTYLIPLALTAAGLALLLRRLRFDWGVVATALAGALVDVIYLSYTSLTERNYDALSHVLYIDTIATDLRLPPVTIFCTACGHPPLYYGLAALWSRVAGAGGLLPHDLTLQWLSLLLSSGFVVGAALLLRSFSLRPATLRLAVALVVFWPSTIINSVRVHNDALAAPLLLTAVYFISRWDRENRSRDFYLALTATAAALLTKATGYAVAATLVTIAGLRAWRARSGTARFDPRSARSAVIAAAVVAGAALLASVSRPSMAPHNLCQKVLGRACDVPDMVLVGNRPLNYLAFDVGGFLHGRSGLAAPPAEDYFWNGLFESSLFGVMPLGRDFDGRFPAGLAVLLRGLLLAMVAVGLLGLAGVRRVTWSTYRAIAAATAIMLVCLLGFRMLLPTPFHEDFRHIFPTLVPLCLGYAKIVERAFRRRPRLGQAGALLAWLMVAASALFFLRL